MFKERKAGFGTMKQLEYKGYTGSIEYSAEDNLLFGKVPFSLGEGWVEANKNNFHSSVIGRRQ